MLKVENGPAPTESAGVSLTPRSKLRFHNPKRRRDPQQAKRWPPEMTSEQIEQAIDKACGCDGKWDCDCVSVFNKTRGDAWYAHNTRGGEGV